MGCFKLSYYPTETPLKVVYSKATANKKSVQRFISLDPVKKEWESGYACENDNPIEKNDVNGDDGKTASAIFVATQESAGLAIECPPCAAAIEVFGDAYALYELLQDAPPYIPAQPPAKTTTPPATPPARTAPPAKAPAKTTPVIKKAKAGEVKQAPTNQNDATKNRVRLRKKTVEDMDSNQPKDEDGNPIDPNDKKPLGNDKTDIGHKPGKEWRTRQKYHNEKGSSRKEVIEEENDPNLYQRERRSNNRSHKYEKK